MQLCEKNIVVFLSSKNIIWNESSTYIYPWQSINSYSSFCLLTKLSDTSQMGFLILISKLFSSEKRYSLVPAELEKEPDGLVIWCRNLFPSEGLPRSQRRLTSSATENIVSLKQDSASGTRWEKERELDSNEFLLSYEEACRGVDDTPSRACPWVNAIVF